MRTTHSHTCLGSLLILLTALGCGASATGSGASEPSSADLGAMRFGDAVATQPDEVCRRLSAILGPPHETTCADGSSGHVTTVDCSTSPHFDVPEGCEVTVAEVEACYGAIAAMPECFATPAELMTVMGEVMGGAACAPMAACGGPASRASGPIRDESGRLTHAGLEAMDAEARATTGTYAETLAALVATYGEPNRTTETDARWYAMDGEDCYVFSFGPATDGTGTGAGMLVPMPAFSCETP